MTPSEWSILNIFVIKIFIDVLNMSEKKGRYNNFNYIYIYDYIKSRAFSYFLLSKLLLSLSKSR